eukprot:PhF_6_TR24002/c0_g2_i3/m.33609
MRQNLCIPVAIAYIDEAGAPKIRGYFGLRSFNRDATIDDKHIGGIYLAPPLNHQNLSFPVIAAATYLARMSGVAWPTKVAWNIIKENVASLYIVLNTIGRMSRDMKDLSFVEAALKTWDNPDKARNMDQYAFGVEDPSAISKVCDWLADQVTRVPESHTPDWVSRTSFGFIPHCVTCGHGLGQNQNVLLTEVVGGLGPKMENLVLTARQFQSSKSTEQLKEEHKVSHSQKKKVNQRNEPQPQASLQESITDDTVTVPTLRILLQALGIPTRLPQESPSVPHTAPVAEDHLVPSTTSISYTWRYCPYTGQPILIRKITF